MLSIPQHEQCHDQTYQPTGFRPGPIQTSDRRINEKANENPSCDIRQFSREIPKPNRQWREQKQYHSCKGVWIDQRGEDSVASQLLEEFGCQLFGMTLLVNKPAKCV